VLERLLAVPDGRTRPSRSAKISTFYREIGEVSTIFRDIRSRRSSWLSPARCRELDFRNLHTAHRRSRYL